MITIKMREIKSLLLSFILVLIISVYNTQVILMTNAARLNVMLPIIAKSNMVSPVMN